MVQVIRNEYVTNVPVHVLGGLGPDRVQVSGAFRSRDALIVGSSVALVPGTLVRFNQGPSARGIEGMSPNPEHGGLDAGITPPAGATTAARRPGTSPSRPASPASRDRGRGAPPF